MPSLLHTLMDLGDMTSRNLEFAYQGQGISYGEETVTEVNMLELRRRHPDRVYLEMFTKPKEAKNGADWEWYFVGRNWVYGMRIQAKRIDKNGCFSVKHKVKSTGIRQIDLLIAAAKTDNLVPAYVFYGANKHMKKWQQAARSGHLFFGCLLAKAEDVERQLPTKISQIENFSVPWHYLIKSHVEAKEDPYPVKHGAHVDVYRVVDRKGKEPEKTFWSLEDINGISEKMEREPIANLEGLWRTDQFDFDAILKARRECDDGPRGVVKFDLREEETRIGTFISIQDGEEDVG